jgi:hypothetical protein
MVITGARERETGSLNFQTRMKIKLNNFQKTSSSSSSTRRTHEHKTFTKTSKWITVGLVSPRRSQISTQFNLKVPLSHESINLGFWFIISNPDLLAYSASFAKLLTSP